MRVYGIHWDIFQRLVHRIRPAGRRDAHEGVQFIDVAVGRDAEFVLADSVAPEQVGLARVAALRIDLHRIEVPSRA